MSRLLDDRPESAPVVSERIGMIVGGSLSKGLTARLDETTSVEDMAVGRYVVIAGEQRKFFGMITDVRLEASSQQMASSPPDVSDALVAEVLAGTSAYGCLEISPMLTLSYDEARKALGPQPVKTVPAHFSPVCSASEQDVSDVFGAEDPDHFYLGQPLDMDVKVCISLRRLTERSSGVFGKSGTGKTFLTRLLLLGLVQSGGAVNLIFDMHNEYGYKGTMEGQREVKGIQQLFPGRVAIFTLDPSSTRARGASYDFEVEIGYDQVEPQDMAMLQEALGLSDAAIESVQRLGRIYGDNHWLQKFLDVDTGPDLEAFAAQHSLNLGTLQVLRRKLDRLTRLSFLKPGVFDDSIKRMLECLTSGLNVVLEFGRQNHLDAYILVANILTRRIHERYVTLKEEAMGGKGQEPKPLVITIEEAHKFLNPKVAEFTIFGTIAREMRKYNVTLLVVDQRPSGIADEVMSQIGTRITCLLDDEKDISAVLSGVSGAQSLRAVLAKLDPKQQALILGYAVPMPVVIRTREYGTEESYRSFMAVEAERSRKQALDDIGKIFGDFGG